MEIPKPKYRFSPSLLNSFQSLLDSDTLYEQFYGDSEDPPMTPEEYYKQKEAELLNAINRVPFSSEAAEKGTIFNELVDCIVENRKPREDMLVQKIYEENKSSVVALHAELNGYAFDFDINLVRSVARYFSGAICQYRTEAPIDTSFGPVILYGDVDYIIKDVVYDLKTTGKYSSYGKFNSGMQKELYPYCLTESGEIVGISGFEYTIITLKDPTKERPFIDGEFHTEWFSFNYDESKRMLRDIAESFIQWIEDHRSLIHHQRIFNN